MHDNQERGGTVRRKESYRNWRIISQLKRPNDERSRSRTLRIIAEAKTRAQFARRGAAPKRSSREIAVTAKRETSKPRLHGRPEKSNESDQFEMSTRVTKAELRRQAANLARS